MQFIKRLNMIQAQFMSTTTTTDSVLAIPVGNALNIKLNKPKGLNALDEEMIAKITNILDNNKTTPVIVLSGEGGKAFCAGGDVKSLYFAKVQPSTEYPPSLLKSFFRTEYILDYKLTTLNQVLVAFMDGIVMGGGVGISVHAPIRIATEKSMFAMPEGKLGLFTDVGGGFFLSRLQHNLGYFLGLTGYRLKGADLVHAGVADYFVEQKNLQNLLQSIGSISTNDIDSVRNIVGKFQNQNMPEFSLAKQVKNIEQGFSGNTYQELYQNLQQLTDQSFSKPQLDILNSSCPISIRVIFEQIKRGKNLDLKENLKMDYRIVRRMMEANDFFEGVKQVLIDKNHIPQWEFKDALTIPDKEVEKYFEILEDELDI